MSIKLSDSGGVLIGPGGEPTEDEDCCCSLAGCQPCDFMIQGVNFSSLTCGAAELSDKPEWNGTLCQSAVDEYISNPDPGPCAVNSNLSINGMVLHFARINKIVPGLWQLTINILRPGCAGEAGLWYGQSVSATPIGTYNEVAGGCSSEPSSFTIVAC